MKKEIKMFSLQMSVVEINRLKAIAKKMNLTSSALIRKFINDRWEHDNSIMQIHYRLDKSQN